MKFQGQTFSSLAITYIIHTHFDKATFDKPYIIIITKIKELTLRYRITVNNVLIYIFFYFFTNTILFGPTQVFFLPTWNKDFPFIAKLKVFLGNPSVLCYKKSKQKKNRTEGNKGTLKMLIHIWTTIWSKVILFSITSDNLCHIWKCPIITACVYQVIISLLSFKNTDIEKYWKYQ